MKKALLILIIQCLCIPSFAQNGEVVPNHKMDKLAFSFTFGAALPEGRFATFEYDPETQSKFGRNIAGEAGNGYYGKVELSYLIYKHLGLTAQFYSSVNNGVKLTDEQMRSTNYTSGHGGGTVITARRNEVNQWRTSGLLIGAYERIGKDRLHFDFKLTAGLQLVTSPEAKIYEEGYTWIFGTGKTGDFYRTETQPSLFSYNIVGNAGVDVVYSLSKKIRIKAGFDTFFSKAVFDGNQLYETTVKNTDGTTQHMETEEYFLFSKYVFILGLNAGISYVYVIK